MARETDATWSNKHKSWLPKRTKVACRLYLMPKGWEHKLQWKYAINQRITDWASETWSFTGRWTSMMRTQIETQVFANWV